MMLPTNNPLLEKLPWAIIIVNIELKVVNSNAAARELFNLNTGDKTFPQDLAWVDQSGMTLPLENHPINQCFKTGEKISGIVMGFSLPSEKQITWIEAHCIPEFGEGNQKPELVVFTFNLTPQPQPLKFDIVAGDIKSLSAADDQPIFESDVLNRIDQAVIVSDLQGNITYTNEAASKMYGWTREEFSERNVLDTTVPDRSSVQASQIMKKLAKGESWSGEFEVKRKDGTIFMAFVTDTPIFNKQGILIGIIGVSMDITKDKKAETDLISSENRFLIMFRSNPIPSGITRASDFRIVDVNDAWCKLTGYSREEAIGYNPVELGLVNPDLLSKVRSISQNHNAAQQAEIELRTRYSEIRHVLINSELIEMGGEKFVLNNLLDITTRKVYEEQLTKLAERLNLATYSAGIGIWDWDIQKNEIVWDEKMVALYGLQSGEFKGAYEAWLNGVHPDDREESNKISQSAVLGEREYDTEFRVLWPDGSVHWLKADGRVIRDENGNAIRMVGVNYDITERKLAEAKLRESEERYRKLAENFPDTTITFYNRDLEVTFVAGEELHKAGKTAGDFIGKRFDKILIPPLAVIAEKSFKRAFNGEINTFEAKSFNERYLKVIAVPVYDSTGIINEIQVISQNITESKKEEHKRLISEQKYTLLFNKSGTPALVFKFPGGIISEVNQKVEELTGYSRDEMIGKTSVEVGFVKPENRVKVLEGIMKNESLFDFELPVITKNGENKTVLVNAVHFYMDDIHYIITTWFDITDRKRAEEKLHESEQKLKLFVEFAPAAIAMFDTDMRYIAVSRRFLIDYGIQEKTIIGRAHYEIFPEIGEEWKAVHRRCLAGASEIKEEDKFPRADGSVDWVHWEIHPWFQADGKIGGIILFSELITERKKALNALEENERRLRKTIETTSDGFWIVDRDRRFIEVNEAYCTMSGYSRAELMTMSITDVEAIETTTDTTDHIQKIIRLGSDRFETIHRRKDGSLFDVEVSVNVFDIEQGLMICFCRDITERKKAEKQLRESEKRFATIFEDSPVAIAISRLKDGKIIMVNSAIIDLLGYNKDELIGQTTNELGIWINPADRQRFVESLSTVQRVEGMEVSLRLKSGDKCMVMIWGELIELGGEPCMMAEVIDITTRKKAEQQLREREAELNEAQVLAKMASWRIDLTNYQLSVSDNYRKLLRIEDETIELTHDYFVSRVHPDDVHLMDLQQYKFTPESAPFTKDYRILMPEGTVKWFQNSMVGEFSEGKMVALKGSFIDITDKKNQEVEIRLQNQKLNAILNALPDKLFVHDATGNFLEAYTTDPGGFIIPMEQFIGKNLQDIFPAEVADLNLKYLYEARKNNKIISHEFSVDYKGMYSHFEVRVVPFLEDKVIRFVRDITERKEIEKQIVKLNKAIEQSPVAIIITDPAANITYASSAIEEMTGYQKHELIGKNIGILKSEKNRKGLYTEIWEKIQSGENWDGELINKKKNGKLYWTHMSITPLYESENQITGYLAVKQDITEKKKNEQEILELNTNLERKVEQRTIQLKNANEELVKAKEAAEQANKAKSIFLANMSHEIRTPLNSIIGFSELLFNSSIDEKKRSQVISIRNSGRSLLNIINDILDLSKVEAGKIVIEREPLNVSKIVSEVGSMFEQKAAEKKLSLTIESETDLITPLLLDETRLRQILFNLVGNAIKFTSTGGVSVVIRHQEKEEDCVDLGITVADTGIGIPQNQLEAIFEPFVQQYGQVQKTFGGTGLGLAISRRMAEAMGGEIRVKSAPNIGSEFTVCLKNVAKGTAHPEEKENTPAIYSTVSFKGNTILIVDDIADNRKLLNDVLEPTGARLYEAENGAQAVRMALALKPDIILMDIRMPVMDGLEACRILKNTPETAKIPCIAVSASIKLGKPGKEIPENFEDNLMKPVVFEHLFEMLLRYLKHAVSKDSAQTTELLTIPEEEPEWPADLKQFAMIELVPLYHHVMRTQLVDEMEDFGKKLIAAGQRFNEEMLISVGQKIGDYADQFEVDKLTQTMKQFQLILDHKLN